MPGEVLVEEDGFFLSDPDTLENIYARILHGLSPQIGQQFDSSTLKLGCKSHFTPLIFARILALQMEENRPQNRLVIDPDLATWKGLLNR